MKIEGRKQDLVTLGRVFYREGLLRKINRKGKSDSYTFFLFSDQLLYGEKKSTGRSWKHAMFFFVCACLWMFSFLKPRC
jgi:hypothetical protein